MGQTLCNVDIQNIDQQAKQLPIITRPQSKLQPPPAIDDATKYKSEERVTNTNAKVNFDQHIHSQPPKYQKEHIQTFRSAYKEPIVLPQPVKQQLQKLGEYKYRNGQSLPRGTMIDQIYLLTNGIKYKGQWKQNKIHGQGKFVLQDGSLLEAYSVSNQVVGVGRLINQNGNYYEGQFKQNQAQGQGRYVEGSIVYEGQFMNNKPHGKGTEQGEAFNFNGHYQNGRRTHGRLQWKDQQGQYEYQGQFKYNQLNGFGQLIDNGKIIKGKFVNGKLTAPTF